jgi:hypothetical protein
MKSPLFGLAVAACLGLPAATFAANGSVAATMVKHASARRIAAEKALVACQSVPAPGKGQCSPGAPPLKNKVSKT